MATKIEKKTLKLPTSFSPEKHAALLDRWVTENLGEGWEVEHMNVGEHSVTASRQTIVTELSDSDGDTKDISLRRDTKPADGDKIAAKLEDDHAGFYLTTFDPYLGAARLTRMQPATVRARGAIAQTLGVKPWDVQISDRKDGGFDLKLPASKYSSMKHDAKLQTTVETDIGQEGWYIDTNPQLLTASIIPAAPPTFPSMVPYPVPHMSKIDRDRTPFGVKLAGFGEASGDEAFIDWTAQAFAMLAGMPGSGKSVTLNALVAGALASGSELVIVDVASKAVDYFWCRDLVRDNGGWGCDSDEASLATLSLVFEEGERRSKIIAEYGVLNWMELPPEVQFKPILVIIDELSGLLVTEKVPSGVPKDNPIVVGKVMRNLVRLSIDDVITRIISQQRAFGIRAILATQITNNNTGIGPSLKGKIGHRLLQGSKPSRVARSQTFNDEASVPTVPGNIQGDGSVSKGVGAAELEGSESFVYKSYYASTKTYRAALDKLNLPIARNPSPTATQISRFNPSIEEDADTPPSRMREEVGGYGHNEQYVERADGLSGAAAAGHDLKVAAAAAKKQPVRHTKVGGDF
jgi:hypothetical protein